MAAPVPAALIGKYNSFDESVEDWTSYIERADQYFVLIGPSDKKKVAAMITSMRAKTYFILRKLTTSNKPSEKTYEEIKKHLSDYFLPAALEMSKKTKKRRAQAQVWKRQMTRHR